MFWPQVFADDERLAGALLVGAAFARSLAWAWQVPAVAIHHMEGHLLAPMLEDDPPEVPFVALLVSGGHSMLVEVKTIGEYRILVLDEDTSNLDPESEVQVQEAIARLLVGRTALIIAHRLSTIRHADKILLLEQHKIAAQGTHDELLAKDGLYAGFWGRQSGGFIGVKAAE